MAEERIHKIIAAAGITSRRKAEELILQGAVTVNGKLITELGQKADPEKDSIKVNGALLMNDVERIYVVYNKPRGVVSALSDPEGRVSLDSLLRELDTRVVPVGRLDYNSEGLLLLTNNGELANKLFRARRIPKTYHIKVKGHFRPEDLDFLKAGIYTKEGVIKFKEITLDEKLRNKTWIGLQISEGSSLDLREILNHRGLLIDRIVRTAIGDMTLEDLQPGEHRLVTKEAFENILSAETEKAPAVIRAHRSAVRTDKRLNPWQERRMKEKSAADPRNEDRRERSERPSFGGRSERPSFGGERRERPSFGGRNDRAERSERPYDRSERPSFGGERRERPSFGGRSERPSFGGRSERPSFGGERRERPSFGGRSERPSFGGRSERPSFGGRSERPSFGGERRERPSSGIGPAPRKASPFGTRSLRDNGHRTGYTPAFKRGGDDEQSSRSAPYPRNRGSEKRGSVRVRSPRRSSF